MKGETHSDVFVVLSQFMGAGDHLPLGDPLLQVVNLSFELRQTQPLLQPPATLLGQVLQPGVQLVDLGLS